MNKSLHQIRERMSLGGKIWWTQNDDGTFTGKTFSPVTFYQTANQDCVECDYFGFKGSGFTAEEAHENAEASFNKEYGF